MAVVAQAIRVHGCRCPWTAALQVDTLDIPQSTQPAAVRLTSEKGDDGAPLERLIIDWDCAVPLHGGEHVQRSEYSLEWLRAHSYSAADRATRLQARPQPVLWTQMAGQPSAEWLPRVDMAAVSSDPGLRAAMSALRDYGAVIINGMPTSVVETQGVCERIGHLQRTFYADGMWDTAPKAAEDINDTAYSNMELKPHTDCTYLSKAPGLQFFNCVAQSSSGGMTWIVDGFSVAAAMKASHPRTFQFFCNVPMTFYAKEDDVHVQATAYVFETDYEGHITGFRFNNDDRAAMSSLTEGQVAAFYEEHLPVLLEMSRSPEVAEELQLQVGDMLILDNNRHDPPAIVQCRLR
ncbi:hypothetical protein CYMTET_32384 [Cymbomonas tetramitiformis]|uniref:TauD/TfdA-like domain-containing protein n=1 Tax=Cymbomonas tetramitiformis TaxID=36881 RepID=A0AAE0FFV5_9CHLO|nr:hypothetical protein CYMTET_32384 [Cymbomonas tetramitiformis]